MKNTLLNTSIAIMMLTGALTVNGQSKGNRTVTINESYDAVRVSGSHILNFRIGTAGEPLTVIGSDEEFDHVDIYVRDNTLHIESRQEEGSKWKNIKGVTVFARNPELKSATVNGSARIDISGDLNNHDNSFKVTGSGKISVAKIDCNRAEFTVTGSGFFQCLSVKANSVEAKVTGSGKLDISGEIADVSATRTGSGKINIGKISADNMTLKGSGSGNITAKGTASTLEAYLSGSGKINASDLKVKRAEVGLRGSGKILIHCTEELTANVSTSGKIYYRGNPVNVKGTGKVNNIIKK